MSESICMLYVIVAYFLGAASTFLFIGLMHFASEKECQHHLKTRQTDEHEEGL